MTFPFSSPNTKLSPFFLLQECKKIEGDPPVVKLPYLNVKDSYISYMDYWKTMYPLLMTELWCELYHDLALQDKSYMPIRTFNGVVRNVIKNPPCLGVDNNVDGRRIISVDCVCKYNNFLLF